MKNSSIFSISSLGVLVFSISFGFTSCGDDDNAASIEAPKFESSDGKVYQLTKAGNYSYAYDEDGRVTNAGSIQISYDPFEVTMPADKDYDDIKVDMSVNSSNNITSIKIETSEDRGDGRTIKSAGQTSYSYSGSHLTKISTNYTEEYIKPSERVDTKGLYTCTISWKGDVITLVQWEEKWTEHYVSERENITDKEEETRVLTPTYSEIANKYNQGTYALKEMFSWETTGCEPFILLGMLGDAPAFHVANIESTRSWTRAVSESDGPGSSTSTKYYLAKNDDLDRLIEERSASSESGLKGGYAQQYYYEYKFAPQLTRSLEPYDVQLPALPVTTKVDFVRSFFTHRTSPSCTKD